ncbi:hypothetical protein AUH73_02990 [archaeon 13_1_40CM_4_53_4]|nr:MAG: hypothetical protein AUI07_08325 [archaeon 13_2_20CM_2_53_6]OLC63072.1 MAG: hypothetical protein AUH73_02990 [archaeon 13_1_40CM_4_53_4]OLE59216.1 MAG: hypothetical protein AUG17_03475 [Crenarchaeota archaeon 13_1_20CM_2_53_14]
MIYLEAPSSPMKLFHWLSRSIWRSWFYFRAGYGTYIALLMGYAGNLVVIYKLAVVGNKYLEVVFYSLTVFAIFGVLISVPTAILLGLFHVKRTGAYAADASLSTEANPYVYKVIPGKEREVFLPLMVLTAKGLAKVMREQNALTRQDKEEFDLVLAKAESLLRGQMIGNPRQKNIP